MFLVDGRDDPDVQTPRSVSLWVFGAWALGFPRGARPPGCWTLPGFLDAPMSLDTATPQNSSQETVVTSTVKAPTKESRVLRRPRSLFSEDAVSLMSRHGYVACKRAVEWLLALLLFLTALPIMVICSVLVRLTSR